MFFDQKEHNTPLMIAGPCSAESEEQVMQISTLLDKEKVDMLRFGVWKPRTSPGSFEGHGKKALPWLQKVREVTQKPICIEVANAQHVELALKAGIDVLWLGARTTVNPFTVQEIADSLKGVDIPVMVKNPVNPDLKLWIGAIERVKTAGLTSIAAIHRGFSSYGTKKYRNEPLWQIPIALKQEMPEIPMIVDPSHIAGKRAYLSEIAQKALDLNYDGIMVEVHPDPSVAMSDAEQQIKASDYADFVNKLQVRNPSFQDGELLTLLDQLRDRIDILDSELVSKIAERLEIVSEIGKYKRENNVSIFQAQRWAEILKTRGEWAEKEGVHLEFVEKMYRLIHDESLRIQTEIYRQHEDD